MASIDSRFQYDIFISYRHNDNRSGWVSTFVKHLQEELHTILKDPVSVYFDENVHDGLLETDIVDDSLRDKLDCAVFIPILSQTYSDTKSFAWQHEFLVFKKRAEESAGSLKVRLPSGNTTSRILPVRIHDLDVEDLTRIEGVVGPLRAIDFIFRAPGVNRPLTTADNRADHHTHTLYRDQVNKVALCFKEIITGLKNGQDTHERHQLRPVEVLPSSRRKRNTTAIIGVIIIALLAIVAFYAFRQPTLDPLDKSIAILPFDDLSENHDQEYFSDGISEELINALAKIEGLKVPSRTSSFQFKGMKMDLTDIGAKLNVALVLEGSVRKSGNHLRITAQLINAKNGYHLWSETYEHEAKDVFKAQDDVTRGIVKQLQKYLGVKTTYIARPMPTQNQKAYDLYLKGHQQFLMKGKHVEQAKMLLEEALKLDPQFALAHAGLAESYAVGDLGTGDPKKALAYAQSALALDSTLSAPYAVTAWILDGVPAATRMKNGPLIHTNFERAIRLDPNNSTARLWYGISLLHAGLFTEAVDQLRLAVSIDPLVGVNYGMMGWAEYFAGSDSLGYVHLQEGIHLGWNAGLQRLAFYYLEHQQYKEAEESFEAHAKKSQMSDTINYHELVQIVRAKDGQKLRKLLQSLKMTRGFSAGFVTRLFVATGDVGGALESLLSNKDGFALLELLRPGREEIRKQPAFAKFVVDSGCVEYWNRYGWPAVCYPIGKNDFACH